MMRIRLVKFSVAFFTLSVAVMAVFGQQPLLDKEPQRDYAVALELFQKEKYAAAQNHFDRALDHRRTLPSIDAENARFYQALCGLLLFNGDAESMMLTFLDHHPEHPKVNTGRFELGRYYFARKRFGDVLDQFQLVDDQLLDAETLEEFYFKRGYAQFQKEEYDKAKESLSRVLAGGKKYRAPALYYHSYTLYREGRNEAALKGFIELEDDRLFGRVVPFYILQIYHRQGKSPKVIEYGSDLAEKEFAKARSGEIHRLLGEAHLDLEEFDQAVPMLESAIAEQGGDREDRYELAYAAYRAGQFEKAIRYFGQVTQKEDELTQLAYYHMGDCYLKSDRKMEARNAFRSASKYAFDEELKEDALFNFAKLAYELSYDPYHEAIEAFEEYIAKNPESKRVDEAYDFLLQVYLATRNYEAALNAIDKMSSVNDKLKETYQRIAFQRATELFNDLRYKAAITFYERSKKYPVDHYRSALADYWQADAYQRLSKWNAAKFMYRKFLEAPGSISLKQFSTAHYDLAYIYFENSRLDSATLWFRKFVDARPSDSLRVNDAFLRIADAYYLQKRNKQAIIYYDKAIKYDRFDTDYAIFQIAVCYGLDGQNASKVETLKAMLENYPESDYAADAKYEIAETYFFTDNGQQALRYFDRIIAEHPNSTYVRKAKLNKGLLFYNQSDDERALPLFKDVAENHPATDEAREALMKIQKIFVERGEVAAFEEYVQEQQFPDITKGALDTSYYEAAEFMYLRGELESAMNEFKTYLQKFPNGYFKLDANYYMADAALQLERYDQALIGYDEVIASAKNAFTEKSLLAAAGIYFYKEQYSEALLRYTMLEEIAELASSLTEARVGLMRTNYLLNRFDEAHRYSVLLRRRDVSSQEILDEASIISAKCALAQNDLKMAEARFRETLLQANNRYGAEAMYNLARIKYLGDEYEEAQRLVTEMVNLFSGYDQWISRGFLLLADTYIAQEDLFQAKLTLQNVIDNYEGELKEEALRKMEKVNALQPKLEERKETQPVELEFEQDGKVNRDIFLEDEVDEDEPYQPDMNQ